MVYSSLNSWPLAHAKDSTHVGGLGSHEILGWAPTFEDMDSILYLASLSKEWLHYTCWGIWVTPAVDQAPSGPRCAFSWRVASLPLFYLVLAKKYPFIFELHDKCHLLQEGYPDSLI